MPKRADREPPSSIALSTLVPATDGDLVPGADLESRELADLHLARADASRSSIDRCAIVRCDLDGASFARARIRGSLVDDIRADTIDLADATLDEVIISGSRLGAVVATAGSWTDVRVRATRLNLLDLRGATVDTLVLEDCVIDELDLSGAHARSLRLAGTSVETLTVEEARLERVDLRGGRIGTVRGVAGLRGAILGAGQLLELAPVLAAHLGVAVRDD